LICTAGRHTAFISCTAAGSSSHIFTGIRTGGDPCDSILSQFSGCGCYCIQKSDDVLSNHCGVWEHKLAKRHLTAYYGKSVGSDWDNVCVSSIDVITPSRLFISLGPSTSQLARNGTSWLIRWFILVLRLLAAWTLRSQLFPGRLSLQTNFGDSMVLFNILPSM
jgi:hypothetical protein